MATLGRSRAKGGLQEGRGHRVWRTALPNRWGLVNQTTLVEAVLAWAEDGRFKEGRAPRPDRLGRLPQLADRIAYARQRIANGGMNAPGLREQSGIQLP